MEQQQLLVPVHLIRLEFQGNEEQQKYNLKIFSNEQNEAFLLCQHHGLAYPTHTRTLHF